MTRISVAMATYNGERYLREQLDSLTAQTWLPAELQVGDDGSTDDTEAIVEEFAHEAPFPVHFHRNPRNLGYGSNFLETARRCSGDWIAFCDQDDVWLPHKLERCAAAAAEAGGKAVMIVHSARVADETLRPTGARLPAGLASRMRPPLSRPLTWSHYGFAQLFRRELVARIEIDPRIPTVFTNIDRYPHDVWISALGNLLGPSIDLGEDLCLYRRHEDSVTATAKAKSGFTLAALLATGGKHYRHVASVCREAGSCLEFHAARVEPPPWRQRLRDGAAAYAELAVALERRSSIYESNLGGRLRALAALALRGGYFGLGASSFGLRALAKDLAVTAVRPFLARSAASRAEEAS